MRHVGILGHSWPGAAECFREVCLHSTRLGRSDHPDVSLDCISFEPVMLAYNAGDYRTVRATLEVSAARLAAAGAEFFICPDNTAHLPLEVDGPPLALPGLHLVKVVAEAAVDAGRQRVGILGTRFTMTGPLYPRELAARGIEAVVPEQADIDMVDDLTFGELVHGVFGDETRSRFVDVINRLKDRGCDAVALVCTEHPLLVTPDVSPLPILDSTRLISRAAVDVALGRRELPVWRGGPAAS